MVSPRRLVALPLAGLVLTAGGVACGGTGPVAAALPLLPGLLAAAPVPANGAAPAVDGAPASGATSAPPAGEPATRLVLDARFGPALLMHSRSKVPRYLLRPALRLGGRVPLWSDRLEVGAAVSGLLVASEHYRVLGLLAHARLAALRPACGCFTVGIGAGAGAGYDADILHKDLDAGGKIAPYGFLSLDIRFRVRRQWLLGAEAAWENLGIVHVGLLAGRRF